MVKISFSAAKKSAFVAAAAVAVAPSSVAARSMERTKMHQDGDGAAISGLPTGEGNEPGPLCQVCDDGDKPSVAAAPLAENEDGKLEKDMPPAKSGNDEPMGKSKLENSVDAEAEPEASNDSKAKAAEPLREGEDLELAQDLPAGGNPNEFLTGDDDDDDQVLLKDNDAAEAAAVADVMYLAGLADDAADSDGLTAEMRALVDERVAKLQAKKWGLGLPNFKSAEQLAADQRAEEEALNREALKDMLEKRLMGSNDYLDMQKSIGEAFLKEEDGDEFLGQERILRRMDKELPKKWHTEKALKTHKAWAKKAAEKAPIRVASDKAGWFASQAERDEKVAAREAVLLQQNDEAYGANVEVEKKRLRDQIFGENAQWKFDKNMKAEVAKAKLEGMPTFSDAATKESRDKLAADKKAEEDAANKAENERMHRLYARYLLRTRLPYERQEKEAAKQEKKRRYDENLAKFDAGLPATGTAASGKAKDDSTYFMATGVQGGDEVSMRRAKDDIGLRDGEEELNRELHEELKAIRDERKEAARVAAEAEAAHRAEIARLAAEEAARVAALEAQRGADEAEAARLAGLTEEPKLAELQEAARKTEEARRAALSEEDRQKGDSHRADMSAEDRHKEDAKRLAAEAQKRGIKTSFNKPKKNDEKKNDENKHFNWMGGVVITALGALTLGGVLIARRSNQDKDDEFDSEESDYSDDENSCGIAEDDLEAGMTDCEAEDGEIAEVSIKQGAGRGDKFKYDDDCATLSPRSNGRARTNSTASSCVSAASATFAKKHRAASPTSTMDDLLLPY